jgi:hypothetical protein
LRCTGHGNFPRLCTDRRRPWASRQLNGKPVALRRSKVKPAVHDGQPVALCALRRHTGCRAWLAAFGHQIVTWHRGAITSRRRRPAAHRDGGHFGSNLGRAGISVRPTCRRGEAPLRQHIQRAAQHLGRKRRTLDFGFQCSAIMNFLYIPICR